MLDGVLCLSVDSRCIEAYLIPVEPFPDSMNSKVKVSVNGSRCFGQERRAWMKLISWYLSLVLIASSGLAKGWRFIGPDSTHWRRAVQMDVSFQQGRPPYVGVGSLQGVCVKMSDHWRYVLIDQHGSFFPPEDIMYRSVYFSPWSDSVAFAGFNLVYVGEPGSKGGQVPNIHASFWGFPWTIGGGYVGHSPSLSFEFSPHHAGCVYSWIIDLYKSTDNGVSWNPQQLYDSYGALFLTFDMSRDSVLYAARNLGQSFFSIYRSTDDGASWVFVCPLSFSPSYPIQRTVDFLANGDTLVLATNHFPGLADSTCGISLSTDHGITWSSMLPNTNVQKVSRDLLNANEIYAATQSGIYRSLNGGVGWELYTDSLPSLNLVDIRKDPYSDTLYVATSDSGVFQVFETSVGVREEAQEPGEHRLLQNYPNPFNSSTRISFQISVVTIVKLIVFDVLGREVTTLVNEMKSPGQYDVGFDAANLAGDVYYYQLRAGRSVSTKKMLLVK